MDASTGMIYGTIIAGSNYLHEGYIFPGLDIMENIKFITGASSVMLPTTQDALCVASRCGENDLIENMKGIGASVNEWDTFGNLPIVEAALNNRHSTVQLLLSWGADLKKFDRKGQLAITGAALAGNSEIIHLLLQFYSESDIFDAYAKKYALQTAITAGRLDVVEILSAAGVRTVPWQTAAAPSAGITDATKPAALLNSVPSKSQGEESHLSRKKTSTADSIKSNDSEV